MACLCCELLLVLVCLNSQKVSPSLSLPGSMQTTLLDLDALARHLADCIRRSVFSHYINLGNKPASDHCCPPPTAEKSWTSRTGRLRTTGSRASFASPPASSSTSLPSSSPARDRSSWGTSTTSSSSSPAWPTALSRNVNLTPQELQPTTCWWRWWRVRWKTTGCFTTGSCLSTCRVRVWLLPFSFVLITLHVG